jgi:bifunctional non-homologous end joining protein LigD
MSLATYKRKRDFGRTPEPAGDESLPGRPPTGDRRFVVQRHRATRLHYDFRFEIDGVLMSWAVPKGPSLNPKDRRMAVHVEDHPLEYFDFEGVIPKRSYGAGDVIVWDWGTFEPEETDDPGAAVRKGELKFTLHGQKLRGRFTLVRIRSDDPAKDDWLLIHKNDDAADPAWEVDDHPRSVKSGRTNDEVAAGAPSIWNSNAPAAEAAIDLSSAREAPLPGFIEPMKATAVDKPFSDDDWLFELKLDGYRVEAVVDDGRVRLWTRNKQDAARYFPHLAGDARAWLDARSAILDGEVVALDEAGRPEFGLLQVSAGLGHLGAPGGRAGDRARSTRGGEKKVPAAVVYYVFDLLYHDGRLLLDVPLEQRKRLLRTVLREHPNIRYASHVEADGEAMLAAVAEQGLEGVIAKLRKSRYEPGRRSKSWLKIKHRREQEVVVCGYELGKGSHAELGSLLVGVYDEKGALHFAGEVGSGLDGRTRRQFRADLDKRRLDEPPVVDPPRLKGARWSSPGPVIRVEFAEWTSDGYLRQPAFKGVDLGKDLKSVRRETTLPMAATVREAEKSVAATAGGRSSKSTAARLAAASSKSAAASRESAAAAPESTAAAPKSAAAAPKSAARASKSVPPSKKAAAPKSAGPARAATADELAALEALGKEGVWIIDGRSIKLTNLDKVLFPQAGFTKRDLIRYYVTIAPTLLPYLRDRAVNLWRWPDGITGGSFWQKEIPHYAPDWIARWAYPDAGSREAHTYIVVDGVATLAWLANHATIDIHPWTSRITAYRQPTYALIDIDPGTKTTFAEVVTLARIYRTALDHLKVKAVPKVTGKRGIQVWVPVRAGYSYDDTRTWVEGLSRAVGSTVPDLVSWAWEKSARRGRARLDYTQNAVNKTLVAPYAVRPVENAPVSAPISWDELDEPSLRPDGWNLRSIFDRLAARGDLFAGVLEVEQDLPELG